MSDYDVEFNGAVSAGARILSVADNTERQIRDKLRKKGFSGDVISSAVAELERLGYLDEKRYIANAVEYYANKKLYGPRRIPLELRNKGFKSENISGVDYSEIDFVSGCADLIRKRGFEGGKLDEKTLAFLQRYGYTNTIIKQALDKAVGDK